MKKYFPCLFKEADVDKVYEFDLDIARKVSKNKNTGSKRKILPKGKSSSLLSLGTTSKNPSLPKDYNIFDVPYTSVSTQDDSTNTKLFSVPKSEKNGKLFSFQGSENPSPALTSPVIRTPREAEISASRSTGTSILAPTSKAIRKVQMQDAFKQFEAEEQEEQLTAPQLHQKELGKHRRRKKRKQKAPQDTDGLKEEHSDLLINETLRQVPKKESVKTLRQGYGNNVKNLFG